MRETKQEEEARIKALEKIAPIREKFLKLLHEARRERVDDKTIKLIVK